MLPAPSTTSRNCCTATNRLAEAEPLYRRALAILEKSLGSDHPNVATALNNLALLLQATNRLAEAEPLYRRALEILLQFSRATGHSASASANIHQQLQGTAQAMGRSQEQILATLREMAPEFSFE